MQANILILGASYGSLLATKLLMAGQSVTLVCTGPTAQLINREGTRTRFPLRDRDGQAGQVEVASRGLPGALRAVTPEDPALDPAGFDLVVLGMQEAQYGAPGVRELMARVARAQRPCLAIMNMPPLPFLARIPGLDTGALRACYADASVWDGFDPALMSLASPDPQAFRPADAPKNVLEVGLPTNFKAARFAAAAPTAMLRALEYAIEAARYDTAGGALEIPVKLKVHESPFVPLAKWPMLLAGNYRCILPERMQAIREAVQGDLAASAAIYAWVSALCVQLGAAPADLVPFEKYAAAAAGLAKPSSAARALFGGAVNIERVDSLVRRIAAQRGLGAAALDEIVARVDARLARNRAAAKTPDMPAGLLGRVAVA